MKRMVCAILFLVSFESYAQKRWDGGAGNDQWSSAENWSPDGVPGVSDNVILDNSIIGGNYTVYLPSGNIATTINSLLISPGNTEIICEIPQSNTVAPAMIVTGDGNALELKTGAIFRNSSGASSGDALIVNNGFRIEDGAKYIHHTSRGNASLIDRLVNDAGTEKGIFEFDVPGAAGYTVSLTGNTFGNLVFSAGSGNKSYNGSGISTLQIRGDLVVNQGATLTSSMTADIIIGHNLEVKGNLQLHPISAGSGNRSLQFNGNPFHISGTGNLSMNSNFNKLILNPGSIGYLNRTVVLTNNSNAFHLKSGSALHCGNFSISGNGNFIMDADAEIFISAHKAIQSFSSDASINTAAASIADQAIFHFTGTEQQHTGTNFPSEIKSLTIDKPSAELILDKHLRIGGNISMLKGIIYSNPNAILTLSECSINSPQNIYGFINEGWEYSFISGPVILEKSGQGEFTAPVGKEMYYAPLRFTKTQADRSSYMVEYFPHTCSELSPLNTLTLDHISQQEFWQIQPMEVSGEVYISLSWRPNSVVSADPAERKSLRVASFSDSGNGNQWSAMGNSPLVEGNDQYGYISSDLPLANFSFLTLGSATIYNTLPLRNISFKTDINKNGIGLSWEVEDMREIVDFVIEKSKTEKDFNLIWRIVPGSDNIQKKFLFTDVSPFAGENFYRIGVRIKNDSMIYSDVSFVNYQPFSRPKLYPNPAREQIFLFFPDLSSKTSYSIVRSNGTVVKMETGVKEKLTRIPIYDLPKGYYSVIVHYKNELIALAFLKY